MSTTQKPPRMRIRRGRPRPDGIPTIRIDVGGVFLELLERDALTAADKIVDLIEAQHREATP